MMLKYRPLSAKLGRFKRVLCAIVLATSALPACQMATATATQEQDSESFKKYGQEFKGKIGRT